MYRLYEGFIEEGEDDYWWYTWDEVGSYTTLDGAVEDAAANNFLAYRVEYGDWGVVAEKGRWDDAPVYY